MSAAAAGPFDCARVEELAPELGLGVLTGIERAGALAHLETCGTCRALVEAMAGVGDSLLALSPEVEPPLGFEDRLMTRRARQVTELAGGMGPGASVRWWQRRALLGVAALALGGALGVGASLAVGAAGQAGFQVEHPAQIGALGGRALAAAALMREGQQVGQVFLYRGNPSWVFMTVDSDGLPSRVTCELVARSGATVVLGSFEISTGYRSWGATIAVDPAAVQAVRLLGPGQETLATATV